MQKPFELFWCCSYVVFSENRLLQGKVSWMVVESLTMQNA